jgi:putative two-component system response regulator
MRQGRILLVDDQEANLRLLEQVLEHAGYSDFATTPDPLAVLSLMSSFRPDIVLLNLNMPKKSGLELLEELAPWTSNASGEFLPVLVLTADTSRGTRKRVLAAGAKDFLTKPFDPVEVTQRVQNLLETRFLHVELKEQNEILEERVRARTKDIWDAVNELEQSRQELRVSREETIVRLAIAAEYRDDETARHIQRMSRYSALLASAAGWDAERVEILRLATQMHDIGKIGIPDKVLLKPRALTPGERAIMEQHAEIGYRILADSDSHLLQLAATIAWTHHERLDGSGYPRGLRGDEIPVEGRIAAIADVFDALTSDRVYRKRYPLVEALRMIRAGRGTTFDADLLDLFLGSIDQVLDIKESYGDEERSRA